MNTFNAYRAEKEIEDNTSFYAPTSLYLAELDNSNEPNKAKVKLLKKFKDGLTSAYKSLGNNTTRETSEDYHQALDMIVEELRFYKAG